MIKRRADFLMAKPATNFHNAFTVFNQHGCINLSQIMGTMSGCGEGQRCGWLRRGVVVHDPEFVELAMDRKIRAVELCSRGFLAPHLSRLA